MTSPSGPAPSRKTLTATTTNTFRTEVTIRTEALRLAAVGDVHCTRGGHAAMQAVFGPLGDRADVLLLVGDLTDWGLPEEAQVLASVLARAVKVPMLGVLGNHDYEGGKADEVRRILGDAGVVILDGETHEMGDV